MKHRFKRIISFSLSICIVIISFLFCPVTVNANPISTAWEAFDKWCTEKGLNYANVITFGISQWGALVDADFSKWLTNQESFMGMWNEDNVVLADDSITFSDDLVAYIKQAIKEYQNEKYGYQIIPTIKYDQIPVSDCFNSTEYRSICELACKYGMIGLCVKIYNGTYRITDLSKYLNGESGFYITQTGSKSVRLNEMDMVAWSDGYDYCFDRYSVPSSNSEVLYTWEDVEAASSQKDRVFAFFYTTFDGSYLPQGSNQFDLLISAHGEDVLVFNNSTSLKNYSVDKRGIYTTSKFYENTGAVTIAVDDLNKSIQDLTGLLEQFKDLIGDQGGGLTEDQLQKLLEKFLEEFFKRLDESNKDDDNNNNDDKNNSNNKYDDSNLLSALGGYFSDVLASLAEGFTSLSSRLDAVIVELGLIYDKIGDMTEDEVSDKTDSLLSQLSSAFSEVGSLLKGKFPFCIPNDIYTMLALLAGDEISVPSGGGGDVVICAYDVSPFGSKDDPRYDPDRESNAPIFEIPFVIGSADIEEKIVIDLAPFDYISKMSRTLLTLYFCVCLMNLTFKVIDLGKDLGND